LGITFARLSDHPFSPQDVELLEEVTPPIAGAVSRALAFEEIARLKKNSSNSSKRRHLMSYRQMPQILEVSS
jgi:GAF domain-containing protein